jgi:hypothetical protein
VQIAESLIELCTSSTLSRSSQATGNQRLSRSEAVCEVNKNDFLDAEAIAEADRLVRKTLE